MRYPGHKLHPWFAMHSRSVITPRLSRATSKAFRDPGNTRPGAAAALTWRSDLCSPIHRTRKSRFICCLPPRRSRVSSRQAPLKTKTLPRNLAKAVQGSEYPWSGPAKPSCVGFPRCARDYVAQHPVSKRRDKSHRRLLNLRGHHLWVSLAALGTMRVPPSPLGNTG